MMKRSRTVEQEVDGLNESRLFSRRAHRFGGVVFPFSVNLQEEEQNER